MSDAPPITGTTSLQPQTAQLSQNTSGQPQLLGTATLINGPDQVLQATRQLLLRGTVSGEASRPGTILLNTSLGDVTVRTGLPLRPGQPLLVQVPPANSGAAGPGGVVLLTPGIGGAAGGGPAQGSAPVTAATGGTPAQTVSVQTSLPSLPPLSVGASIRAVVLPSIAGAAGTLSGLPSGSALTGATASGGTLPGGSAAPSPGVVLTGIGGGQLSGGAAASGIAQAGTAGAVSSQPGSASVGSSVNNAPNIPVSLTAQLSAGSGGSQASGTNSAGTGNPAGATAGSPTGPAPAATGTGTFPPSSVLGQVRILGIQPPPQPGAAATLAQPTGQAAPQGAPATTGTAPALTPSPGTVPITASVVQSSATGPALAQIGNNMLLLEGRGQLTPGTRVTLELSQPLSQATTPSATPVQNAGHGKGWPALEQALTTLQAVQSGTAQALLSATPQVGTKLSTSMIFFMTALRLGSVRAFASNPVMQALADAGNGAIARELDDDFMQMARQTSEPVQGDWRAYSIPVMNDGEISVIQLFLKRFSHENGQGNEGDNSGAEHGTRFVIDMEFTELGALQIDGLAQERRMDVIFRSQRLIPQEVREGLQALYTDLMERGGLTGGIVFRNNAEGWLDLMPDPGRGQSEDGLHNTLMA